MGGAFGAMTLGADGVRLALHQEIVDTVFEQATGLRRLAINPVPVGLVVAEEQGRRLAQMQSHLGQIRVFRRGLGLRDGCDHRTIGPVAPVPDIARPELGQHMQARLFRTAISDGDAHQDVVGGRLRILDEDIEVAAFVENAGVDQLVFRVLVAALVVLRDEMIVGVCRLRILVEHPHEGMGRCAVEVVIQLLHVLAVIAFLVGEAEQPLLDDRVLAVPEGEAETPAQVPFPKSREAVLTPAIGAAARLIVGDGVPGVAVGAVVLAHGPPLAFTEIGAPVPPSGMASGRDEPPALGGVEQRGGVRRHGVLQRQGVRRRATTGTRLPIDGRRGSRNQPIFDLPAL